MNMEHYIRAIAGIMVLISLVLAITQSIYWLLLTAFFGLNLLQAAFTRWCLMEDIPAKFGVAKRCV